MTKPSSAATDLEAGGVDPQVGPSIAPTVRRTVGNSLEWREFMRIDPSSGRERNAFSLPSITSHGQLSWLLEIPVMPIAFTRSSTERVEMPRTSFVGETVPRTVSWSSSPWITAVRAFSAVRCGSRKPGTELPFPSLGMRNSTAPARVSRSRSRYPLRCARRTGSFAPQAPPANARTFSSISRPAAKAIISRRFTMSVVVGGPPGPDWRQQPDPAGTSPVTTSART
jgi:hypothetical protein